MFLLDVGPGLGDDVAVGPGDRRAMVRERENIFLTIFFYFFFLGSGGSGTFSEEKSGFGIFCQVSFRELVPHIARHVATSGAATVHEITLRRHFRRRVPPTSDLVSVFFFLGGSDSGESDRVG